MESEVLKTLLEILIGNPITVTLLIMGSVCIIIAIVGEIPSLRDKLTGARAFFLGVFGVFLMVLSVGLAWTLTPNSTLIATDTLIPTSTATYQPTATPMADIPTNTSTAFITNSTPKLIALTPITTNVPFSISTSTLEPPTATATNVPTPTNTSTLIQSSTHMQTLTPPLLVCGDENHTALKTGLVDSVRELVTPGAMKTYSHCPSFSSIRYIDVTVDDDLAKVELVCPDSTKEIRSLFSVLTVAGALLPHYESQIIELSSGCRVDFTVQDILGGNIGLDFQAVVVSNPVAPTTTLSPTVQPRICTSVPPDSLIPLWENTEPPWSKGLWGSPNLLNFVVGVGIIDTNDPEFSEFQLWIDPCFAGTIPGHGYTDGGRFWPKQPGVNVNAPPIVLGGETATLIAIPANTGQWDLGPRQ